MEENILDNPGLAFHGECTIVRADLIGETELPEDAVAVERDQQGRLLVAHSESGHHHYIEQGSAVLYKTGNPLISYLQVEADSHALLKHAKPSGDSDRHATQRIGPGLHRINIQRENTPEGWRRVED